MVSEVKAYRASDGTLFPDIVNAARHDAKLQLITIIDNEAYRNAILTNAQEVFAALGPLVRELNQTDEFETARQTFMNR